MSEPASSPATSPEPQSSSSKSSSSVIKFAALGLGKIQGKNFTIGITDNHFHVVESTDKTSKYNWKNVHRISFSEKETMFKVVFTNRSRQNYSLITPEKWLEFKNLAQSYPTVKAKIKQRSKKMRLSEPRTRLRSSLHKLCGTSDDYVDFPSTSSDDSCPTKETFLSDNSVCTVPDLPSSEVCPESPTEVKPDSGSTVQVVDVHVEFQASTSKPDE